MPIYEYECTACGHKEEFMQKVADAPLKKCPNCGKNKLFKQISASGFQLKGEGWYVTDFRDKKLKTKAKNDSQPESTKTKETKKPPESKSDK